MCKVQTHVSVPGEVWARIVIACGARGNSPLEVVQCVEDQQLAVDMLALKVDELIQRIVDLSWEETE